MRVSQDVMEVLDRGRCEGAAFYLPPGQLDRKLYEAVNKVLVAAGGRWDRKAKGHVFTEPAEAALDPILLTGEVTDAKKELQAFFTPDELAEEVVAEACIGVGMKVLEPSAGLGSIARFARDDAGEVRCVELHPTFCEELRVSIDPDVVCADFMRTDFVELGGPFDRVVGNPPFTRQQDARHLLHAYGMLKPGGRLVFIMSASVTFRETALYREVRDLVASTGGRIEKLPDGSFKESGTSVNTVLVVIDKPDLAAQDAEAAAGMRSAA